MPPSENVSASFLFIPFCDFIYAVFRWFLSAEAGVYFFGFDGAAID